MASSQHTATPKPTPAPTTINIVAVWLQGLADIADDVIVGNSVWIPKHELSADDAAAIAARLPTGMQWIADNPLNYIVRAAAGDEQREQLTPAEIKFHTAWRGHIVTLRSERDAVQLSEGKIPSNSSNSSPKKAKSHKSIA